MLARPTLEAGRALLGASLVREDPAGRRVGRIVEVEAYIGQDDGASHARFGLTRRNRPMFGPAGVAYVYLIYGLHHCLNVVTERAGVGAALLIRAVEPVDGIEAMRAARDAVRARGRGGSGAVGPLRDEPSDWPSVRPIAAERLAAGPGLVAIAFGITRADDGLDLCDPRSPLRLEPGVSVPEVLAAPRVGIEYAPEPWRSHPWRLLVAGSRSLSRPAPGGSSPVAGRRRAPSS